MEEHEFTYWVIEYISCESNERWSYDKLQSHYGNVGSVGKMIQQFTLDNTLIQEFESICSAAKQLNISKSGIIRCCKGKQKQCGGFTFKYITNENI